MKHIVKSILKVFISQKWRKIARWYGIAFKRYSIIEVLMNGRTYDDKTPGSLSSTKLYRRMFNEARVKCANNYLYTFDPLKARLLPHDIDLLTSITPDYSIVLQSDIREIDRQLTSSEVDDQNFIESIKIIIEAVIQKAENIKAKHYKEKRDSMLALKIPELLYRDCKSLDEAIQKLLFYNGLYWQAGHKHNGLGRLDLVLVPYYQRDIDAGILTYDSAKQMLKDMCLLLGSQIRGKSAMLLGDTGQYILLGGIDQRGNNIDNDLTRMFLEIFTEIKIPDPKLIIRVNRWTSKETWLHCVKCLSNGCGSPLFMNEELIMDNMIKFGYEKKDVWNVGTSACWEPLIIGKSSDQNNPFRSVLTCESLHEVIFSGKDYRSFEEMFSDVKHSLAINSTKVVTDLNCDYSPLMSLFMPECIERKKDFSHGGSKYMHQGIQLLGIPNLVDSLLNIKEYVFKRHLVTLDECREVVCNNYRGREDLRLLFSNANELKFGSMHSEVISLCQELIEEVSKSIEHITSNGNKVKFGLSSPSYITQSKTGRATLDGRRKGEPYAVHISPISSSIDINETLDFAASFNYPINCLNGNVVDFILPVAYLEQPDKFIGMIHNAFTNGLFQLQLNVLDKQTLIDAKAHPDKYPNLVVRVWGFSAYFNELPEEYKDNLIARSTTYETA